MRLYRGNCEGTEQLRIEKRKEREAMIGSMIGTVANILLDPVLISGFHLGAAGAAVATTLGNILASIYYLWYFIKKSSNFSISLKYFTCRNVMNILALNTIPIAATFRLQFWIRKSGALSGDCSLYQEVLCDHWCSGHAAVFCITQINHRTFHPG